MDILQDICVHSANIVYNVYRSLEEEIEDGVGSRHTIFDRVSMLTGKYQTISLFMIMTEM